MRFCSRPMPRAAPPAPPRATGLTGPEQGPNRDAPAAAGPEQTGLADRAPAAGSAAVAGSPQAARWQVWVAVPRLQPAGVAKALGVGRGRGDEQGGRGAARAARWRLREARRAPRVAGCLPVLRPLCPADMAQPTILAGWRAGFCTPPKWSEAPVRPAAWCAARGRSILGTVSLQCSIDRPWCAGCRPGHHNVIPGSAVLHASLRTTMGVRRRATVRRIRALRALLCGASGPCARSRAGLGQFLTSWTAF